MSWIASCTSRLLQAAGRRKSRKLRRPNSSLIPVPPRHHGPGLVPGGVSIFDFTDSAKPTEIAFSSWSSRREAADHRGLMATVLVQRLFYATEIARGLTCSD